MKRYLVILAAIMSVWYLPQAHAQGEHYTAITQDGVALEMLRYHPPALPDGQEPPVNSAGEPVLLFSGIVCNMNEFLVHTPPERAAEYAGFELDEPLPAWAADDPFIAEDPLRLYNLAHYLWLKGYDPWFANYRGTGRGEYQSGKGGLLTTLDIWAALDVPACIEIVRGITGKDPFIGGHSTGGLVSYAYLQGVTLDVAELGQDGLPHIFADPLLSVERNRSIKGFIGIDPAGIPPMPAYLNQDLLWSLLWIPAYIDLDTLIGETLNTHLPDKEPIILGVDLLMELIFGLDDLYALFGEQLPEIMNIFGYLTFWNTRNMPPLVEDYFARYAASSCYLRALSQYYDFGMHQVVREHWTNGEENRTRLVGPAPAPKTDGYYYYTLPWPYENDSPANNMRRMRVPAVVVLSYTDSLVQATQIIRDVMEAKTPHELDDEPHLIPNTGHVDVVCGSNAPYLTFEYIGSWLDEVCAAAAEETVEESARDEGEGAADKAAAVLNAGDDGGGYCFVSACRVLDR